MSELMMTDDPGRTTKSGAAKFWDGIAEKYAAKPVEDTEAFERKKAVTRDLLTPESTVLEVGCGTGSLALEMAPHAGHIHGLDVSAEMVRIANQKKAAQGVTQVTFRQGTLDGSLPFGPGTLDSVWAYSFLHLVDDRPAELGTLYELLRPGGTFVSSNVCLGEGWVPFGPLLAVMRSLGKAPPVSIYDRDTALREIRQAGFVDVEEIDVGAKKMVVFVVARKPE